MKVKKTFVSRLALLLLAVCMVAVLASCDQLFGKETGTTEATTPDAGTTAPDAGTTAPDAGTTAPDAGTTAPEAGTTAPEAGTTAPDTGDDKPADRVDTSDLYYYSFAESFFTTEGIAVKINDFVIDVETDDSTPNGLQKINSLEVAELEISLKNGELYGAAHGKAYVTFFDTIDGSVEFSAIISDGYLYFALTGDTSNMDEEMYQKYSLESLLGDSMDADPEVLAFIENTLLPTVESLINKNAVNIDTVLGNVLNIFFTFEKQTDNTVLVTLSKDKVLALNEALATKPIAEVIDVYFGEGAYDSIVDGVFEILDLKISEIPAYLKSKGIDYDDLVEKISAFLPLMGAPEDFDEVLDELLTNSDFSNLIIGDILMGGIAGDENTDDEAMPAENTEDAPLDYKTFIEENILVILEEATLYDLMGATADAKAMVDDVIAQVFDFVSLSFVTEEKGAFKNVQVTLNNIPVGGSSMGTNDSPNGDMNGVKPMGDSSTIITYTYYLSASIEVVANGTVEVTWGDIIEKINASLAPVPEEFKDEYGFQADDNGWIEEDARITFAGQEYICQSRSIWVSVVDFDTVLSTAISSDCAGWFNYEMSLRTKKYNYQTYFAGTDDAPILFLVNPDTEEIVKIEPVSGGFNVTNEEGKTEYIIMAIGEEDSMMTVTAKLFPLAFETVEYIYDSINVDFYYNPTTKEYAYEEQHEWEYSYKMLGTTCEDGYECTETCTKCGYKNTSTEYYHRTTYTETDLSALGMCGGSAGETYCTVCKTVTYASAHDDCWWEFVENVDGYDIYECQNCGATKKQKISNVQNGCESDVTETIIYIVNGKEIFNYTNRYTSSSHDWECSYEMFGNTCEDGYMVTEYCTRCGQNHSWKSSGHEKGGEKETDLEEFGLCGGILSEGYCHICEAVTDIYLDAYNCNWETVEETDTTWTQKCSICNAILTEIYTDEGYTYIIIVDGQEVYNKTVSYK